MVSREKINKLSEKQAKIALLKLLEDSYNTAAGTIWAKKIDEAIALAEKYSAEE